MRRAVTLLALFLAAGTLMSCDTYNRNTFKLTIEVEVDGERKIASSVYEREINWNLGGVADRTRGTMPHMSLGRHGDIVLSMRGGGNFLGNRNAIKPDEPPFVSTEFTWYFPPFDQGQNQPDRPILYPRNDAVVVPVGKLLSLPVVWRPPGVNDITQFQSTWFHSLAETIDPAVRPVRITIEPTWEPLLYRIPDAPDWIVSWRQQFQVFTDRNPMNGAMDHVYIGRIEARRGT